MARAALLGAATLAGACFSERSTEPQDTAPCEGTTTPCAVEVRDNSFSPVTRRVTVGSTVHWAYDGPSAHNVTSETGAWPQSPLLTAGDTFERTFDDAGQFPYVCTLHAGMSGTIVVE